MNTPASPTNSPTKLMATIQTKTILGRLVHFIHLGSVPCSSIYSPAAPSARIKPHSRMVISDASSHLSVAGFEIDADEKRYPMSPYRILGGIGVVITGIGIAILQTCAIIVPCPPEQAKHKRNDARKTRFCWLSPSWKTSWARSGTGRNQNQSE